MQRVNFTFYITVTYSYKTFTYIIAIHLQVCYVDVIVAVYFRVKWLMSTECSHYVTYPDKSAYIQCAELCEWPKS